MSAANVHRRLQAALDEGKTLDLDASALKIDGTAVTSTAAELNILDGVTATAAELNRTADASARVVTTTATALSLTATQHGERVLVVDTNSTVANTFTLPAASGTGNTYTIINNIAQTQGSVVVAAAGSDVLKGVAYGFGSTEEAAEAFFTTASSDKVTFNRTTTGGLGGDTVELIDVASGSWYVRVFYNGSGAIGTPFSES